MIYFQDYSTAAMQFAKVPAGAELSYGGLKLAGEAGEVADKLGKSLAGHVPLDRGAVLLELGDVLWYVNYLARTLGSSIQEVASLNIKKLASREERGTLMGEGDDR